ncbi:glutamate receptor 2.7-like isoform X1 [Rhododendron vialii]|uniref:glutamate receptor 2.7-like isoform X1 n=2 Tax=Rhododendron vialii TaxID=182163 RepID=UPI00265EA7E3|nr:glutamate receptor 2.7-like isoform X1 [Rhododendron vialii]
MIFLLVILSLGSVDVAADNMVTNIGGIINHNSRIGKEQKTAMDIAVHNFNKRSTMHYLAVHYHKLGGDPLLAAYAAKELINEKHVVMIIGMETWSETALVASVGNQAQVPVISLAAGAIKTRQWPLLVQMANDVSEQMNCVAAIVQSNWRRVVVVYEEDMYAGVPAMLPLLSEALQKVGSYIVHHLAVAPFSSLSNPKQFVHEKLMRLKSSQPRAFIVLHASLPMTTVLFTEAKKMDFVGKDSVWVLTDSVASLLDSANSSFFSSMEGVVGIKTEYSENSKPFLEFYEQYRQRFQLEYAEEENYKPGIYALRAYDSIAAITAALDRDNKTFTSERLLDSLQSSSFTGLSGEIHFEDGRLSYQSIYRVINVFNMTYNKLGYWSPDFGFSKSLDVAEYGKNDSSGKGNTFLKLVDGFIKPPGDLKRVPEGWTMPSLENPLIIGVPGNATSENLVKITSIKNSAEKIYSGFCIRVFEEVKRILEYDLPSRYVEFNGTYDNLVGNVANKTFGAAVGDVTILSKRWSGVEFTEPFTESGLLMVVPAKPAHKAWIFLKPFTVETWLATGAVLIYTMFVVWFLEHRSNPEFGGPWKDQLGNVLWFTFSSLFLAHREKIQSNYARVVVVVWLFVALILTQSYTASLTSMLTISLLQPSVESLKMSNAKVGGDANLLKTYVQDVLQYKPENLMPMHNENDYLRSFENGSISAAFLEIPYAKVFANKYCRKYTVYGSSYRLGGFGFVFQKGSPIAADVSKAILQLMENGTLKRLEEEWLTPSAECRNSQTDKNIDVLSFQSFWGLYLFSIATSSICFMLFLAKLLKSFYHDHESGDIHGSDDSVWNKTVRLGRYLYKAETGNPRRAPTSSREHPTSET